MKTNLNNQKGAYAYEINNNIQKIYALYENPTINVNILKLKIVEMVKDAHDTPAKRNFLNVLMKQRSKDDVVMYISNVTLRAEHLSANIDDKWANEK